jgi:hypothetical protein
VAPETQTTQHQTQEQSIKARKNELFEEEARNAEEGVGPVRPFRAYLRETPAAPLSLGVKASLWGTGAVVGLLFVAAIAGGHGTRAKVPTGLIIPTTTPLSIAPSIASHTAAPAPALTPTPGPDKKVEKKDKERKEKKNAPKPVVTAKAETPKPEPPEPEGPKSETTVKAGTPKPENPTPAPAPAPATVAAPAPTPTPMPGVAANNATTEPGNTAKPGTAATAEAPKTVQLNPQPALGAAPTNTAEATPKEQVKKKSSIFKKKKPPVFSYPKREPRPERKEPLPDLSNPSTSTP